MASPRKILSPSVDPARLPDGKAPLKRPPPRWLSLSHHLSGRSPADQPRFVGLPPTQRLINRNLSWLAFNDRVLNEADDSAVPPVERLRFAGIVSSNLDEFFMVRVAEVARIARRHPSHRFPDGMSATQVLAQIREHVLRQKGSQAEIFHRLLLDLAKRDIHILAEFGENRRLDRAVAARMPEVKYLIRRTTEAVPPLASEKIHVFVRFPGEYAILTIEDRDARLLPLPAKAGSLKYALLDRWLAQRADRIFSNRDVLESFPFKIIRDADLRYHPDEEESLQEQIVEAVHRRLKAKVIRLEVDTPFYSEGAFFLATALGLDSAALYRFDLPLDLRTLARLYGTRVGRELAYPPVKPYLPRRWAGRTSPFRLMKERDILLHHPYDAFDIVVKFLNEAARDPKVRRIYHTLYRTSRESPLLEALKKAAKNGKKVTVYVEIKARFDELANVRAADALRKAGVRVVRPFGGYKVHSKLTLVVRDEGGEEAYYLHMGTGNYHPTTARQYTDLGLLTCDGELGRDAATYFAALTRRKMPEGLTSMLVAPGNLSTQIIRLIREETRIQERGGRGHIIAKMNSLVDPAIIDALYKASQAGVRVDLIVRGICCLRPGVKGLSEHIHVTSVIDRFLEHSRIFCFHSEGNEKIYLSSADWMPRNFYSRYEIAFPVKDPLLRHFVRDVILKTSLSDNVKAWTMEPDGTYRKKTPKPGERPVRSQFEFEALARRRYRGTILAQRL